MADLKETLDETRQDISANQDKFARNITLLILLIVPIAIVLGTALAIAVGGR